MKTIKDFVEESIKIGQGKFGKTTKVPTLDIEQLSDAADVLNEQLSIAKQRGKIILTPQLKQAVDAVTTATNRLKAELAKKK